MEITEVSVIPFDTGGVGGRIKAFAEIVLDQALHLKGLKVLEAEGGGLFIGYPSQRDGEGRYHDLVIPLTRELKEQIRSRILDAYRHLPPEGRPGLMNPQD